MPSSNDPERRRRSIAIVGATGGIGRAIVETFLSENVALYLSGGARFDELRKLVPPKNGASIRSFRADLASVDSAANLVEELLGALRADQGSERPTLDGLVVASGVDLMTLENKALDFAARLEKAWRIDVASTISIARGLSKALSEREDGSTGGCVLFGWSGVARGQEGETSQIYAACKGAVVAFAKSLAQELAPKVRVNSISPGWIKTTWGEIASPKARARAERDSLLGRWGAAREVASAVRFLLSEDAAFVNGVDLPIDGGFSVARDK